MTRTLEAVDEHEDALGSVIASDADVVEPACVTQGDRAAGIDAVLADAEAGSWRECASGGVCLVSGVERVAWGGAAACSVGAHVVVVGGEAVELCLQLDDGRWSRLAGEEPFERLVEPFDLAAGLGMVGARVLQLDAQGEQLGLERGGAAAVLGGVDKAVIGEDRRGQPPAAGRVAEQPHDAVGGRDPERAAGDQHPRVVVDDLADLDVGVVSETPVRHIRLPALVRQRRFEAGP